MKFMFQNLENISISFSLTAKKKKKKKRIELKVSFVKLLFVELDNLSFFPIFYLFCNFLVYI